MAETGAANRAEGKDDRNNRRAVKGGETWSGVSEPSSQQRVSVKAVKGAGKEKEDFFTGTGIDRSSIKGIQGL